MAVYCYRDKNGRTLEISRPMGSPPRYVVRGGVRFYRDFGAEQGVPECSWSRHTGNFWRGSPLESENAGCLPRQSAEWEKASRMAGHDVRVVNGKVQFQSRRQRNRYLKWRNMYDKDAGYGDYSGDVVKSSPFDPFDGD